jgi:hypothetical protein
MASPVDDISESLERDTHLRGRGSLKKALAAAVIMLTLASFSAAEVITSDQNSDGKADLWFTMQGESLIEYSADRNYDGVMDQKVFFDEDGMVQYEELDFNWDGQMDDFYFYSNGTLIRQEIDTNYDGSPDMWVHIIDGVYVEKIEQDGDFDGVVDRTISYGE